MHLYIYVSYFVCCLSHTLTHSLRLCKPHLAQHKYIISRRLHWMPLKLESFSRETTCLHATVSVAVTFLPAPLVIKGSARNRQDVRLTGRSPIRASHAKNRLISITGWSISSFLFISSISFFSASCQCDITFFEETHPAIYIYVAMFARIIRDPASPAAEVSIRVFDASLQIIFFNNVLVSNFWAKVNITARQPTEERGGLSRAH